MCPSNSEDCMCTTAFLVENGFINNKRVVVERIIVIEHDSFKDVKTSIQKIILHGTAGSTTQACKDAFKNGRKNSKGIIEHYGTHFIVGYPVVGWEAVTYLQA